MGAAVISALAGFLLRLVGTLLITALGAMFADVIVGLIGQAVNLVANSISSTSVSGLPSVSTSLLSLPTPMLMIMKRIRLDEAFGIVVTAIGVRAAGSLLLWLRAARRGVPPS